MPLEGEYATQQTMFALRTFILVAISASVAFTQDIDLRHVRRAFNEAKIPQDLGIHFQPEAFLEVTYPHHDAFLPPALSAGVRLPVNATVQEPTFRVIGHCGEGPFVVAMFDPDAPTPQNRSLGTISHFVGANFKLGNFHDPFLLVSNTPALHSYHEPHPPATSDPHRYIFLLFNQPSGFNKQTYITSDPPLRPHFNVSQFITETGLGQPIGGTFMIVGPNGSSEA